MKEQSLDEIINNRPSIDNLSQKEILEDYYIKIFQNIISNSVFTETYGNKTLKNEYGDKIPRVSVTLNNKIMLLNKEFKEKGMSLFVTTFDYEKYGLSKEYTAPSFVGNAIIHDLLDKTNDAKIELYFCSQELVMEKVLIKSSPIQNLFSKIRGFFVSNKQRNFQQNENSESQMHFDNYKKLDREIWEYNLEDNLVQALVKEITVKEDGEYFYRVSDIPGLLEENVITDLKKLGYEHLIPELQNALVEKYKQDLLENKGLEVEEKDMHLYVPDFSKKETNKFKEQYKSNLTLEEQSEQLKILYKQGEQIKKELNDFEIED